MASTSGMRKMELESESGDSSGELEGEACDADGAMPCGGGKEGAEAGA